jgi:hypothetical protein
VSHATLYVRFADGAVRYGWYDGSNDVVLAPLFDTPQEVWARRPQTGAHGHGGEPVRLATDYGGGSSWDGRATHEHVIDGGAQDWPGYEAGLPTWARYPDSR